MNGFREEAEGFALNAILSARTLTKRREAEVKLSRSLGSFIPAT